MTTWAQSESWRHIGFDRTVNRVDVNPNVHVSIADRLICLPWAPGRADVWLPRQRHFLCNAPLLCVTVSHISPSGRPNCARPWRRAGWITWRKFIFRK
eukprot:1182694-Prorocentrum_minimum.AAC.1